MKVDVATHGAYLVAVDAPMVSGATVDITHVWPLGPDGQPAVDPDARPTVLLVVGSTGPPHRPNEGALLALGFTVVGYGDTTLGDPAVAGPGALTLLRETWSHTRPAHLNGSAR